MQEVKMERIVMIFFSAVCVANVYEAIKSSPVVYDTEINLFHQQESDSVKNQGSDNFTIDVNSLPIKQDKIKLKKDVTNKLPNKPIPAAPISRSTNFFRVGRNKTESNCGCNEIYDPVCASNDHSYYNECHFECAKVHAAQAVTNGTVVGDVHIVHRGNCIPF
ncbi:hypothetical protein O0L34_g1817 [Tuta absoluta]|nr:hypothetical protein O0L34_g1817 [Tuta absoluta]